MLDLCDVQVHYEAIQALKGVSIRVEAGEIVSILGANGAGKSTVLRAISGLEPLSGGAILLDGAPLAANTRAHEIVRRGITHCPEGRHIFPECTVLENLELGGYTLGSRDRFRKTSNGRFTTSPASRNAGGSWARR
jgi:branched-chain amino acid transport system ATP-binding protein